MAEFKLHIDMDNAAFESDDGRAELSRILRKLASEVLGWEVKGNIRDVNGNTCGGWSLNHLSPEAHEDDSDD